MPKKILFITLSNVGDAVLTLPALDCLRAKFPGSDIVVIGSAAVKGLFEESPQVTEFIAYDKRAPLKQRFSLALSLLREQFCLVVDLKNSFLGLLLKLKSGSPVILSIPGRIKHMRLRHLFRAGCSIEEKCPAISICISGKEEDTVTGMLSGAGIKPGEKIIVISAGARSHTKRWPQERFASVALKLIRESGAKIVLVGSREDEGVNRHISNAVGSGILDLTGKTSLRQLACLLKKASLVVSNDSAIMHMASYFDTPTLAIFGISDDGKYGPWAQKCAVVKKEVFCRPCSRAQCRFGTLACINLVKEEDLLSAARKLLAGAQQPAAGGKDSYKRILIVRTDRIGDVLLSTPAIRAVRRNFPNAFIAAMVSPYTREIVEGSPYLDEVIIYDKDVKHKGWLASAAFARGLGKRKFELAVILHPTNRAHLVSFMAGIPRRAGYNRKFGFLLTDKIAHTKERGEKHELEYSLDLLKYLGIEAADKCLFMPVKKESEAWVEEFLRGNGVGKEDKLLVINPAASCPSKVWDAQRFAQAADALAREYGFKVLITCGPKDLSLAGQVSSKMRTPSISLAGKTSVSQLASLLKRCSLFVSNDSGPVHIASAVGTPVISIFGRSQPGLSPKRWGPVGAKDKFLHGSAGCIECLAHNCRKEFACLNSITVEQVVSCAASILKQ